MGWWPFGKKKRGRSPRLEPRLLGRDGIPPLLRRSVRDQLIKDLGLGHMPVATNVVPIRPKNNVVPFRAKPKLVKVSEKSMGEPPPLRPEMDLLIRNLIWRLAEDEVLCMTIEKIDDISPPEDPSAA